MLGQLALSWGSGITNRPPTVYTAVRFREPLGGALPATKSRNILTGSASSARTIAMNSIRSISFLASACCRTPDACRTATRVAISRA